MTRLSAHAVRSASAPFAGFAGAAMGALIGLGLGAKVVARFGQHHLPATADAAALVAFLAAVFALVGTVGALSARALLLWTRRLPPWSLAVAALLASATWAQALLRTSPMRVLFSPLHAAVIALGLVASTAVLGGGRAVRRGEIVALTLVPLALVPLGLWLNFAVIRKSDEPAAGQLNLVLLAAAHLAVGWVAWGLRRHSEAPVTSPRSAWIALALLCVGLASALLPLQALARRAFRSAIAEPVSPAAPFVWPEAHDGARPERPSLVLISIDTLRADHVGTYGYQEPTTPRMDRFFAQGVVFEQCHSTASWTLPAHASLLTGQYPSTHGAELNPVQVQGRVDPIEPRSHTIAELLSSEGYATAAFTGGGTVSRAFDMHRGFDTFVETRSSRMREAIDLGLRWVDSVGNAPFFLFLHAYDVHRYDPKATFAALPEPVYEGQVRAIRRRAGTAVEDFCVADGFYDLSGADIEYLTWLYDTELRGADAQLGRLFDELDRRGLLERAVVVVTADHGEEFGEHGAVGHAFDMFETLLHVPLMIRAPGIAPRRVRGVVSGVDVAPTLLQLAGLPASAAAGMQGMSLLPAMRGAAPPATRVVLAEADALASRRAAIGERYKLIDNDRFTLDPFEPDHVLLFARSLFDPRLTGRQLYDLTRDPGESRDLSAREPAQLRALAEQLERIGRPLSRDRSSDEAPATPRRMDAQVEQRLRALGYAQ